MPTRLSARGRQGISGARCGGGDPVAQPSFRGRTVAGRSGAEPVAEERADAARYSRAGSPDRRGVGRAVVGPTWADLTQVTRHEWLCLRPHCALLRAACAPSAGRLAWPLRSLLPSRAAAAPESSAAPAGRASAFASSLDGAPAPAGSAFKAAKGLRGPAEPTSDQQPRRAPMQQRD
jgi:hypothetical protein